MVWTSEDTKTKSYDHRKLTPHFQKFRGFPISFRNWSFTSLRHHGPPEFRVFGPDLWWRSSGTLDSGYDFCMKKIFKKYSTLKKTSIWKPVIVQKGVATKSTKAVPAKNSKSLAAIFAKSVSALFRLWCPRKWEAPANEKSHQPTPHTFVRQNERY